MKGIENLLGMVGLDPEKLTRMFAAQLDAVRQHYDQAFVRLGMQFSVQHRDVMEALHRLDERLDVIEASLAKIDPEFVSADFRRHYGLAMPAQPAFEAASIGQDDDDTGQAYAPNGALQAGPALIEHDGMAHP